MRPSKTDLFRSVAIAAMVIASGCANSEYLERRDTITIGAGDAVARNRAVQTINPRPRHAYRTRLSTDGTRINNAMESYRAPPGSEETDSSPDADNKNSNQKPSGLSPQ